MSSIAVLADDLATPWAAVSTHPHRETVALENLQRQLFTTYCPLVRRRRSHARRVDDVLRPLFPGYLFVRVEEESASWRSILSTYGVRTLVRCGNRPSLVDPRFIQALKAREIDGAIVRPAEPYRVGQRVKVTQGPFDGIVGTIVSLEPRDRLTVLFNIMNYPARKHLEMAHVVPA